ncbi:MAG: PEP-CTERM sorting domain-containing protein [Candidatus Anammoxibacter sp.]
MKLKSYLVMVISFGIFSINVSLPASSYAAEYNAALTFETEGQSIWGAGGADIFKSNLSIGTSWNTGVTTIGGITGSENEVIIPGFHTDTTYWSHWHSDLETHFDAGIWECHGDFCLEGHFHDIIHDHGNWHDHVLVPGFDTDPVIADTRTGGEASASTSGSAGFNVNSTLDSGSVDASLNYDVSLNIPDNLLTPGEFFSLSPTSNLLDGSFNTNLSEATGEVQAFLGATADLSGQGCFLGFGCGEGSTSVGFGEQTLDLLTFNDDDNPGEIKILGVLDPAAFQFGAPVDVLSQGSVTIYVPDLNTDGNLSGNTLTSSGSSDFIDLLVDLDGLMLTALGLPPLTGVSIDVGPLSIGYDLVDVGSGVAIDILQDFSLTPQLMVDMSFSRPVLIDGYDDLMTSWTGAWDVLPNIALADYGSVEVTPSFYVDVLFTNNTTLGIDGVFTVDALQAEFAISKFGLSLDIGELGPLYSFEASADFFDLPSLYSNAFTLSGFNRIEGDSFTLSSFNRIEGDSFTLSPVPEPSTWILLSFGLVFMVFFGRKKIGNKK